jgi:hypothetical protein
MRGVRLRRLCSLPRTALVPTAGRWVLASAGGGLSQFQPKEAGRGQASPPSCALAGDCGEVSRWGQRTALFLSGTFGPPSCPPAHRTLHTEGACRHAARTAYQEHLDCCSGTPASLHASSGVYTLLMRNPAHAATCQHKQGAICVTLGCLNTVFQSPCNSRSLRWATICLWFYTVAACSPHTQARVRHVLSWCLIRLHDEARAQLQRC